ncbi:zinc-binding alcohol dehydrogenase [Paenibacillus hemerocallicola]|uniref:Zinc-binding alcohol dehydrogenase n=1 Tax=Paenibacillus hemerocallicola TaxID=1172614 RepID=A0A5C4T3P9_9BACL|nr:zinc-binding alcohol dehydrogenase [Paenibacillus hemerocallicola]TNJ63702.1 zinc-binding alcohol dehydrogenase [Paenibacillus hemerocallicola]
MKVVTSSRGNVQTQHIPEPECSDNYVIVENVYSAISPGTEMLMIDRSKQIDQAVVLGYSSAGIVREAGAGVDKLSVGQRVACYGAPFVRHAEKIAVPKHLAVPLPEHVDFREAAFVAHGAIAIHALRQSDLRFGETAVVVGLGILGQLLCQIASAAGFRVIGFDLLPERCDQLRASGAGWACSGADELAEAIKERSEGAGADAVFICAGGKAGGLIDQALAWLRDRGKVVIVGDVKTEFDRNRLFGKEAQVLISRAGGPGRYDPVYEGGGIDYPIGYVRWTEGRNMSEYVRLLAEGKVRIGSMITSSVPIDEAASAYERFMSDPRGQLGVLLSYERIPAELGV